MAVFVLRKGPIYGDFRAVALWRLERCGVFEFGGMCVEVILSVLIKVYYDCGSATLMRRLYITGRDDWYTTVAPPLPLTGQWAPNWCTTIASPLPTIVLPKQSSVESVNNLRLCSVLRAQKQEARSCSCYVGNIL